MSARAAARPRTPAQQLAQTRQQTDLARVGVLAGVLLLVGQFAIPSPIAGVDWRAIVWGTIGPALTHPVPPPGMGLPAFPLLQWVIWLVVLVLVLFAWQLILHLLALYAQRMAPLRVPRTVLRLRVPSSELLKPDDGIGVLRTLHGVLPPVSLVRGGPTPIILRWTGRPERPAVQTVSLPTRPDLIMSVQKTLEGLARGTRADQVDDPLAALAQPGTVLAWADARLTAGNDLPIAPLTASGGSPLLDSLLPALAPQTGVLACEIQILAAPIADRAWRSPVVARLESLKTDADASEKQAIQMKAKGPSYTVTIRALALARDPSSAAAQVQTLGAALAGSTQSAGMQQQRLMLGAVQVLPAVPPPVTPPPVKLLQGCFMAGIVASMAVLFGLVWLGLVPYPPTLGGRVRIFLLACLIGLLPVLIAGTWAYRRSGAAAAEQLQAVRVGRMPLRNPNLVMLFGPWLGRKD